MVLDTFLKQGSQRTSPGRETIVVFVFPILTSFLICYHFVFNSAGLAVTKMTWRQKKSLEKLEKKASLPTQKLYIDRFSAKRLISFFLGTFLEVFFALFFIAFVQIQNLKAKRKKNWKKFKFQLIVLYPKLPQTLQRYIFIKQLFCIYLVGS